MQVTGRTNSLIFTDLDGTLLNHHDYRYEPVLPLVDSLTHDGVLIVLATSKTLPEVVSWQERLGIAGPFMVENGSAVYFPESEYGRDDLPGQVDTEEGWLRVLLGARMDELDRFLAPYADRVTSFISCPIDEAMALTSLGEADVQLARQRSYSIPLVVDDEALSSVMRKEAEVAGLRMLKGGRFMHLQGNADKGMALRLVKDVIDRKVGAPQVSIALGDNENDLDMLEAADIGVVVRTDRGHQVRIERPGTIYTEQTAPEGWVEGVEAALAMAD